MQPRPPRIFQAEDILSGRVRLDGYPLRYIFLVMDFDRFWDDLRITPRDRSRVDVLLSAVEVLEQQGWEMAGLDAGGKLICMRRLL